MYLSFLQRIDFQIVNKINNYSLLACIDSHIKTQTHHSKLKTKNLI
jgi:hypothetical protein